MKLNANLVLIVGLVVMALGMALVTFGVVVSGLFFAGVYLLEFGLLATGAGAVLRLIVTPTP
jgi:hypothetical protein